jgi:hypothetical protein
MKEGNMPAEPPPNDVGKLWRDQREELVKMSLDEIRGKARKYERQIRRRNGVEYVAIAAVVAFFGFSMLRLENALMRVGEGMCIAGGLYVAYQLHRRGSARAVPGDMALTSCIDFRLRELERQRDYLQGSWSWYLGPLVPGMVVIMLAGALANPGHLRHPRLFIAAYAGVCALAFFWVRQLHKRCVRKLQGQIDELDAVRKQS